MALIEISETQLAFGYFHSYINVYRPKRFMLPSIRQEGLARRFPFPGADLILNNNYLIQFKRPFYFITNGIKEFSHYAKPRDIDPPYFRFYIKNEDPTNQLNCLVRATQNGLSAEYISPLFTEENEFFTLIKDDYLHLQSYAHIDIASFHGMLKSIGNNNDHTIIYNAQTIGNGFCYCFSEPKKIKALKLNDNIIRNDERAFKVADIIKLLDSIFFPKDPTLFETNNVRYQCQILQNRLFIERDIIWYFNYTINR